MIRTVARKGQILALACALCIGAIDARADTPTPPSAADVAALRTRAATGDAAAQQMLGTAYYQGNGVPKDLAQAFAWCLKAARQGNLDAEKSVSYFYHKGEGVAQDEEQAFQWRVKVAQTGDRAAELAVANCLLNGIGTAKNSAQAVEWYGKAANQGDPEAKTRLGVIYLTGHEVPVDLEKGFTYLLNATPGNGFAAYLVAKCYRDGLFVPRDSVQACMWELYAASLTPNEELSGFLISLKADMTVAEIRLAEEKAQALPRFMDGHFQTPDLGSTFANGKSSLIHDEFLLNTLLIPVPTPDKRKAFLLFDTGASVPVLSDAFARRLGIRGRDYFPAVGIGQDASLGTVSGNIAFSLPGVTYRNAHWAILPNVMFDSTYGRPIAGILGLDLLKDFVIRIDYVGQTIEFMRPEAFKPPGSDTVCLPLIMSDQGAMVEATIKTEHGQATGKFLIDTGNNSALDLSKHFQDSHPDVRLKHVGQGGATGIGGTLLVSRAVCPSLELGGISIPDSLVELDQAVQGVQAMMDGGIGNEIWRRFDMTMDLPGRKLYLKKNTHFSDPFSYVSAGMSVLASGPDFKTLTVDQVRPGTPGEKAGFKSGDVLVKIDELGVAPLTVASVYPRLHQPGTLHVTVKRGEASILLTLELADPPFAK